MSTDTDNALSIEIARLMGWLKWPTGGWLEPQQKSNDHPCLPAPYKCHSDPPRYATDPAAALGLLAYTLQQKFRGEYPLSVYTMRHALETPGWIVVIEVVRPNGFVPEVMTGTGDDWTGEGETLTLAMARVCRDTLAAVREGEERP